MAGTVYLLCGRQCPANLESPSPVAAVGIFTTLENALLRAIEEQHNRTFCFHDDFPLFVQSIVLDGAGDWTHHPIVRCPQSGRLRYA